MSIQMATLLNEYNNYQRKNGFNYSSLSNSIQGKRNNQTMTYLSLPCINQNLEHRTPVEHVFQIPVQQIPVQQNPVQQILLVPSFVQNMPVMKQKSIQNYPSRYPNQLQSELNSFNLESPSDSNRFIFNAPILDNTTQWNINQYNYLINKGINHGGNDYRSNNSEDNESNTHYPDISNNNNYQPNIVPTRLISTKSIPCIIKNNGNMNNPIAENDSNDCKSFKNSNFSNDKGAQNNYEENNNNKKENVKRKSKNSVKEKYNSVLKIISLPGSKLPDEKEAKIVYKGDHEYKEKREFKLCIENQNGIFSNVKFIRIILNEKHEIFSDKSEKGSFYNIRDESCKDDLNFIEANFIDKKKFDISFPFKGKNKKTCYNKINILFMKEDKKTEVFKVKVSLETGRGRQRKNNEKEGEMPYKGFYEKKQKIDIINELLEFEKKNGGKLFVFLEEIMKEKGELGQNSEQQKLEEKLLKELKNNKIDCDEKLNTININTIITKIEDCKDRNKKVSLLILCFDIIYERFMVNADDKGIIGYLYQNHKNFIENYKNGKSGEHYLVLIDDQVESGVDETPKSPKRTHPNEQIEEETNKKLRRSNTSTIVLDKLNKKSDSDSLLVDHS
ncbi:hypothetical protein BCR36DRAFT_356456 [Piromyces finnis]|uniref:Uncharacterized protein n=1 Tax=Piromyces finnis TaxID=1754191 RepID=A0A1Y1V5F2_9FUNG|nr:hypothetical protein BCR36DRAFT_356456 [Piromyces finnis]|eukprot:ORX46925.1 hypothetical protein BCR36DRAFT_356456 [Piromyces finnis]